MEVVERSVEIEAALMLMLLLLVVVELVLLGLMLELMLVVKTGLRESTCWLCLWLKEAEVVGSYFQNWKTRM
jgi:hypothetical protein